MPDLAILIVSWNVRDLLRGCLSAMYAELDAQRLDAEVWVVDNASHDGSPEMVRAEFPKARLVESPHNLGFAGGNNLGLQQMAAAAPPPYVLLLNPDTEVRPGALAALLGFMDRHPRVGIAGAQLLYGDGSFQHGAFSFPGLWQILFDLYPMPSRLYETRLNGRYPRAWYQRGAPFPIDHPLGAAMLVRWATIDQVGLLDESFFMYCEEIDWCMRVKRHGWQIFCVPQAQVVHHAGQSTRQIRATSFANLWRSRHRLYEKHYSVGKRWLAGWLVRVGMRYQKWQIQKQPHRHALDAGEVDAYVEAFDDVSHCFG
jgi:N-acetylglucosaminyl-diphospho-decaprenol L-rhamnosyltransferase